MKKLSIVSLSLVFVTLSLFAFTIIFNSNECQADEIKPVVSLENSLVKLDKNAKIDIKGTGFTPGQELNFIFVTSDGAKADIGYALKPVPKPDTSGSWITVWDAGRYVSSKLVKEGDYQLIITDSDYIPLAQTVISFTK